MARKALDPTTHVQGKTSVKHITYVLVAQVSEEVVDTKTGNVTVDNYNLQSQPLTNPERLSDYRITQKSYGKGIAKGCSFWTGDPIPLFRGSKPTEHTFTMTAMCPGEFVDQPDSGAIADSIFNGVSQTEDSPL